VKKTSGSTTTFYLWDNENLIAEYSATGQRTKRYAYIPNRHAALQIEDANGIYNVHTNHLDTPTQLTDATQKIVWQANYQAFGNTQINQDPDANGKSIVYNQRFPGQYADAETGLYYNFYRDYDPGTGRYLQSDPIGLNGGINLYAYVAGNPLYWIDPRGLNPLAGAIEGGAIGSGFGPAGTVAGAVIGAAAGAVIGGAIGDLLSDPSADPVDDPDGGMCPIMNSEGESSENEHTKNKRPSTQGKHEKGKTRQGKDRKGGEKGDANRPYQR
jgi:hypothetical protein